MAELLHVPYLGTAEDEVVLADWLVAEGDRFHKGQPIAVVETLKAAFEVEAEADGALLRRAAAAGDTLPARGVLGVIGAPDEQADAAAIDALLAAAPTAAAPVEAVAAAEPRPPSTPAIAAAPAARERARELGVDLAAVAGTGPGGLVKVADVEAHAAAAPSGAPGAGDGRLDPDFVAHLRRERDAFAALSSAFKVALYRRHGAALGEGVEIGPGAVLVVERLVLGAGARFGEHSTVEASELTAGALAQFGPRCRIRCRRIELGDNAFFAPDVEVGGGGAMDPEAELVVGSHGFVGEHSHLNPCRRLQLGDEVVISRGASLMTHSFGGSVLQGYPNRFAPITIGDRCQVGIGAMLFPGVEMGEGSILLSNSTLVTSIPPGRMFGGVPAKDMRAAARELSAAQRAAVAAELVAEFARQLELRGRHVALERGADALAVTVDGGHRLVLAGNRPADGGDLPREEIWVAPAIGDAELAELPPELTAIDLGAARMHGGGGPLADAFREFLRKRGVRLEPRSWTYPGGWL